MAKRNRTQSQRPQQRAARSGAADAGDGSDVNADNSKPGRSALERARERARAPKGQAEGTIEAGELEALDPAAAANPAEIDLDAFDEDEDDAAPVKPSGRLSKSEIDRAAAIEAEIVAQERTAAAQRSRDRGRKPEESRREARSFAAQAREDYTYVSRDLRHVVFVNGGILALLIAIWAVVSVAHIGPF